jgi:hypothetical protein
LETIISPQNEMWVKGVKVKQWRKIKLLEKVEYENH